MENLVPQEHVSSYSVASLLNVLGVKPRVQNDKHVCFSFDGYEFSIVISGDHLLLHFDDTVFREDGLTLISDISAILASINKKINNDFGSLSIFTTKKSEVGIEVT